MTLASLDASHAWAHVALGVLPHRVVAAFDAEYKLRADRDPATFRRGGLRARLHREPRAPWHIWTLP